MRALVFRLLLPDFAVSVDLIKVDPKFDQPSAAVSKLLDDITFALPGTIGLEFPSISLVGE